MRHVVVILLGVLFFTAGCRTRPIMICGTALSFLDTARAESQAQASPIVFCSKQEADLVLTISMTVPGALSQRTADIYFRQKRSNERVPLGDKIERLTPLDSTPSSAMDRTSVSIRGPDLWVVTEVTWGTPDPASFGSLSLGRLVAFSTDLHLAEGGGVLSCTWKRNRAK